MKMYKRILSMTLALLMIVAMFPSFAMDASAAAETGLVKSAYSEFYPTTNTYNTVSSNMAQTGYGTVVFGENATTVTDMVWTTYYASHFTGEPLGYDWITTSSSNEDVATVTATTVQQDGRHYLKVDIIPGTQTNGTATIQVGFTVTSCKVIAGIASSDQTAYAVSGYLVYNVTAGEGDSTTDPDPDPEDKPAPPTATHINDFYDSTYGAVRVACQDGGNCTIAKVSQLKVDGYTIGDVLPYTGQNADLTASEWSYVCYVEIDRQYYLDLWNSNYSGRYGTHGLVNAQETLYAPFYYFKGGYCTYAGSYLSEDWYCLSDDAPLYIYITKATKNYSLSYNANGGTGAPSAQSKTTVDGSYTFTISSTEPTYENHLFAGWADSSSAADAKYAPGDQITLYRQAPSKTLYAVWKDDANNNGKDDATEEKVTVTYQDGAEGSVFADEVYENLLPGTKTPAFTGSTEREDYLFMGWNPTVADQVGETDVTYVAQWSEDKNGNDIPDEQEYVTVTYKDGAEGSVFMDDVHENLLPGTDTPAFTGSTERNGYAFTGWTPTVAETVTADAVYTAQWEQTVIPIQVSFNDSEGSPIGQAQLITQGNVAVPTVTDTDTHTFAGWTLDPYVSTPTLYNGGWSYDDMYQIANMGSDMGYVTFFAVTNKICNHNEHYSEYQWNDNGDGTHTATCVCGMVLTEQTGTHYYPDGAEKCYYCEALKPAPITYTITWKNGETTLKTDTVNAGETPIYSGETPTKAATAQYSYTFAGWDPEVVTAVGDATYTAKFTETVNKYTVTWMDGENELKSEKVEYGAATPDYAPPAREGYKFTGWTPAVAETVTADAVYTAKWEKIVKTITVNFAGITADPVILTEDDSADKWLPLITPGATQNMTGWYLGEEKLFDNGESVNYTDLAEKAEFDADGKASLTLTAKFAGFGTITFNVNDTAGKAVTMKMAVNKRTGNAAEVIATVDVVDGTGTIQLDAEIFAALKANDVLDSDPVTPDTWALDTLAIVRTISAMEGAVIKTSNINESVRITADIASAGFAVTFECIVKEQEATDPSEPSEPSEPDCDHDTHYSEWKYVDNKDGETHSTECVCGEIIGTNPHYFVDGICTWCKAEDPSNPELTVEKIGVNFVYGNGDVAAVGFILDKTNNINNLPDSVLPGVKLEGKLVAWTYGDTTLKAGSEITFEAAVKMLAEQNISADGKEAYITFWAKAIEYTPMYRMYNPYTLEDLFVNADELYLEDAGWVNKGIAWYAAVEGPAVTRMYNPNGDFHIYSRDEAEIAVMVAAGWQKDGIATYCAGEEYGVPVYRLFNPNVEPDTTCYHYYTTNLNAVDAYKAAGWTLDGIAWYAVSAA